MLITEQDFDMLSNTQMQWNGYDWEIQADRFESHVTFDHRLIAIGAWDYWSIVPSMIDLLTKIASCAFVIIGWQVRHFLIM